MLVVGISHLGGLKKQMQVAIENGQTNQTKLNLLVEINHLGGTKESLKIRTHRIGMEGALSLVTSHPVGKKM